jgi:hypothetical protein
VNPLAVRFDEFLQRYMRNNRIFFSCAFNPSRKSMTTCCIPC